jgi:hypothetical protein
MLCFSLVLMFLEFLLWSAFCTERWLPVSPVREAVSLSISVF